MDVFEGTDKCLPKAVVMEGEGSASRTVDTIHFRPDPDDPSRYTIVDWTANIELLGWRCVVLLQLFRISHTAAVCAEPNSLYIFWT